MLKEEEEEYNNILFVIGGILLTAIVFTCIACIIKYGNKLIDVRTDKMIAAEKAAKKDKAQACK